MTQDVQTTAATSAIVNEVVLSSVQGKKWYLSKTIWANVVMIVAIMLQTNYGFIVSLELQALALAGINLGLRKITDLPLTW